MNDKPDPVEAIVQEVLDGMGIAYRRDDPLDFECNEFAIECKQFPSDRTLAQIGQRTDVILIHGLPAAEAFRDLFLLAKEKKWSPPKQPKKNWTRVRFFEAARDDPECVVGEVNEKGQVTITKGDVLVLVFPEASGEACRVSTLGFPSSGRQCRYKEAAFYLNLE